MDMLPKMPSTVAGAPFVFSGYEIEECYDKRGKFHLGQLRKRQEEKVLQASLLMRHGIVLENLEEVRRHVTPISFSVVKARRARWGYYLMTVTYRYKGVVYTQVFRFVRNQSGGLSGCLYPNP